MRGVSAVDDKRLRCPRCRARSTIQSTVELRPGIQYLTLRCISCGHVHDAQMPAAQPTASSMILPLAVEPIGP
jgi:uncharacterized Zn finger protein